MIKSMTGFGRAEIKKDNISAEVEIKSLNSRFLELIVKLPKALSYYEYEIRDILKKSFNRGKIVFSVKVEIDAKSGYSSLIDKNSLGNVIETIRDIKSEIRDKSPLKVEDVLRLSSLIITDDIADEEVQKQVITESTYKAIEELKKMRLNEGTELSKDLEMRLSIIQEKLVKIREIERTAIVEYFDRLVGKAKELFEELGAYSDRLQTELALLVEKYDITEEIVRLESHVKAFRDALNLEDEAGRKLNFLCQEMNREANTINSKSLSYELSSYGIDIKEQLEKIREQIQNIE